MLFSSCAAFSLSARLTWDRHQELDVTGYIAYWGLSQPFQDSLDVGKVEFALIDNLQMNKTYRFAVRAYDRSRNLGSLSASVSFFTGTIKEENEQKSLTLPNFAAIPNPFSENVRFTFQGLSQFNPHTLLIYNLKGQLIKTAKLSANTTFYSWGGRDNNGKKLPEGMYLAKVRSNKGIFTRKVFLVR